MSIPASQIVAVNPGVLGAGGNPLSLNGVFLTGDPSVPIGTVMSFSTLVDVGNFFGQGSTEYKRAAIYFAGWSNSTSKPGTVFFAQYNTAAVAGYLRGASLKGVALSVIQALTGVLTLSLDGVSTVSAAINLSSATSFSNAAGLIQTALRAGTPTNTATVTYDGQRNAFLVTSSTTGATSSVSVAAVDSIATGLALTAAAGAVTSVGAAIAVPSVLMSAIAASQANWFKFTTITEPVDATKLLFAAWVQTQGDAYCYVQSDTNVAPAASNDVPSSFGATVNAADDDAVVAIWDPTGGDLAAFNLGVCASINVSDTNGRITYAFKGQPGIVPTVTDATTANNLIANGYDFYGDYATPNDQFQWYYSGSISGAWSWDDTFTNQRIINAALQLALMSLLGNTNAVPYTQVGYNLIRAAALDPIQQALNFGAIVPGVVLTNAQAAEVNQAAGTKIDQTLQNLGYYLQVKDPGGQVRAARGSPVCNLWYTDGGAVQKITLGSVAVL